MNNIGPSFYKTLVLVTDQFACERIIRAGRVIADMTSSDLAVLSVMSCGTQTNPLALEHLFGVAKEHDAGMTVEFSDHPQSAIMQFIRRNRVVNVITGVPRDDSSILVQMWKQLRNITFFTVNEQGELIEVTNGSIVQI